MQNPDATPAEVKEKIKSTAIDMGDDDRFYYGAGMLSFANLTNESGLDAPVPSVTSGLYHEAQTMSATADRMTEITLHMLLKAVTFLCHTKLLHHIGRVMLSIKTGMRFSTAF